MKRAAVVLALLALVAPARASAHATPVRTVPENGAVVARAPQVVRVEFDDVVRVAPGNAAVENATGSSALGGAPRALGDVLTIPLRAGLHEGDYSVRWSIVSDDGHREQGVLAFAVGAGRGSPHSVLGAAAQLTWNDVLLRSLYYLGLLAGGGAAVFWLMSRRLLGERLNGPLARLLFFSLLLVFLGGSGIVHAAPPGTRFALVLKVALVVALAGGAAAALAPTMGRLLPVAAAAAIALLLAPTLSGHALDANQPRVLAPLVDLAHMASAAIWLGGLLALVFVVPRATEDAALRTAAVRRFSTAALSSVAVLALTGLVRALTELSSVSQVWSTSYGRALVVKTLLFLPLLGIGWLNRTLLLGAFARLRRSALVEIGVIAGIVVAVAILTELRPGTEAHGMNAAPLAAAMPAVLPGRDAVVDGRELGSLAVGVARTRSEATVTLIGPDGTGVHGRSVLVNDRRTTSCGSGCYRAAAQPGVLTVRVDGRSLPFDVSPQAPSAAGVVRALTASYRASKSIVFDETLRSSPTQVVMTRFTAVAPHSLSYATHGGASAVVIGATRWDRERAGAPWVRSEQTPLDVTRPYWGDVTNAHLVAPGVVTFLDRRLPAWFRVEFSGTRPSAMHMTAAAHFMVDRYVAFDGPAAVSPPPSR